MPILTRDAIRQCQDLKTEEVFIPEWGGSVFVRSMTALERDKLETETVKGRKVNIVGLRARVAILTVVDREGHQLFTDDDYVWLKQKNAAALNRIFEVASRLSGITEGDIDEMEKN